MRMLRWGIDCRGGFRFLKRAVCFAAVLLSAPLLADESPQPKVDFNRQIRPILSDNCFHCHGPDAATREADLRLDTREGAFDKRDSEPSIVAGDSAASLLYQRIAAKDVDERMPPADSEKTLTAEQVALIKRWIDEGANWESHWSFVVPKRPPVPKIDSASIASQNTIQNSGQAAEAPAPSTQPAAQPPARQYRVHNAVDAFIADRLRRERLGMSPEADRVTLIRRVTFDLTGLPPTLAEVEAFVNDTSENAYEKLVDRLLASPRYGEHMARFWLDLARYGDTHGLHLDNERAIWPYRDWVIEAFNRNLPYDQFVIEQLGGDLLPNATLDQRVATGFNRCNVTTSEGGAIDEEFYVRYNVDRVETTGTVFMGLTLGCAVCHDHKYDPLTQKDFYSLFAFFNSTPERAMDGNSLDPPPVVKLRPPEVQKRLDELTVQLAALRKQQAKRKQSDEVKRGLVEWLASPAADVALHQSEPSGLYAHWTFDKLEGDEIQSNCGEQHKGKLIDGPEKVPGKHGDALKFSSKSYVDFGNCGDFDREVAFSFGAWINAPKRGHGAVIAKMDDSSSRRGYELFLDRGVPTVTFGSSKGRAIRVAARRQIAADTWQHLFVTYDGSSKAAGVRIYIDGVPVKLNVRGDSLDGSIRSDLPLRIGRRSLRSAFDGGSVDDVRIYQRNLSAEEVAALAGFDSLGAILAVEANERTAEQQDALLNFYLKQYDEPYRELVEAIVPVEEEQQAIERTPAPRTMVMHELPEPKVAYILERGEYDKRGEPVDRATPAVLPPLPDGAPVNRLGLAQWLVDPSHPLTSRVQVNRFWQQLFGQGLVATSEDFGSQGQPPTHPELFDWLAVEFRESGWDMKRMMKLLVMSAAYRQSSRITPEHLERDPENILLARGPRFRLDAEMVRDQALAVSGLLVEKIGGKSVKPYQPAGLWEAVSYTSSNTAKFKADTGDALYRRSMYTFWKRTSPPPTLTLFDAPSRESCTPRRSRTNTPTQALALMNDVQFVEASRHFAARGMLEGGDTPESRASYLFRLATSRPANQTELKILIQTYEKHLADFKSNEGGAKELLAVGDSPRLDSLDPVEHATWTMVANLILNLDEIVTKR